MYDTKENWKCLLYLHKKIYQVQNHIAFSWKVSHRRIIETSSIGKFFNQLISDKEDRDRATV
jgi:hypothetical protein